MLDLFSRPMRAPGDFTREGRIALCAEAAKALFAGVAPSREAALFLGGAIASWLTEGGDLARDFLRVTAPRGSHRRPEVVAREFLIDDERQGAADGPECGHRNEDAA